MRLKRHSAYHRQVAPRRAAGGFSYGRRWRKVRRLVLSSEPSCRVCGRPATEVHHIEKASERPDLAYDLDNLMPLCRACHDDQHGGGSRKQ